MARDSRKIIGKATVPIDRNRYRWWVLGFLGAAAGLWWAMPSPIDAVAYLSAEAPLEGVLAPAGGKLRQAHLIAEGKVHGGEDVAVDAQGRIYTGTIDGRIVRVNLGPNDDEDIEIFAETGGRPLGLDFDDVSGELIVADAVKGLLAVDRQGKITELATEADGVPFGLADDVDVSRDGQKIYFSDASARFGLDRHLFDLLEARPHGRLLEYDRATGETTTLLDSLYFANGVALSQHEDFVLVNETYRYRIQRCWLPPSQRAGQCEVFADNIPGFPDGIASDQQGSFWLALYSPRNRLLDRWLHPSPWVKNQLAKLPGFLWPKPESYGLVLQLDETGRVVRSLHDPDGRHIRGVTSVEPRGAELYLGNLDGDWIARWRP